MAANGRQCNQRSKLYVPAQTVEEAMPRGDKGSYTAKQKRKAEHSEESYKSRGGVSAGEAKRRAWATTNKETGGGKIGPGQGGKPCFDAQRRTQGRMPERRPQEELSRCTTPNSRKPRLEPRLSVVYVFYSSTPNTRAYGSS
jgi:hypothetical protein